LVSRESFRSTADGEPAVPVGVLVAGGAVAAAGFDDDPSPAEFDGGEGGGAD